MGLKSVWGLIKAAADGWIEDSAPRLGAALAFYTVFALSPLFIIVIFIVSLWFDQASVRAALFDQVGSLLGQKGAMAIESSLRASLPPGQGLVASIIAVGTLLVTATGVFGELQADLNTIWGVEQKPGRGVRSFIITRLLSFAMLIGIGFLLLVSLVLSAALAALGKYFSGLFPEFNFLSLLFNGLLSFAIITLLFAMIFKFLPDVKVGWSDVWVGAVLTALLFTGGKFLLGFYLGRNATVSAYGAAGSLILILLWVYYSAQILFFGAELTQAYACRFGRRMEPKAHAQWMRRQPDPASPKPAAAQKKVARLQHKEARLDALQDAMRRSGEKPEERPPEDSGRPGRASLPDREL